MARSEVRTWLSLDRWARIMGFSPLSFNQLDSNTLFVSTACGEVWFQDSWNHSDRVGRDDLAHAIQEAELEIAQEVGYNLLPDWTLEERLPYPRPATPGTFGRYGVNARGVMKSVEALRGHLITGGVRAKSVIQAGAAIVRSDVDTDGYQETCTVIVPTTVTDVNEIHVYYPAESGADEWEIRPLKSVSISGGNATITFYVWQIGAANQMYALDAKPLDADNVNSYESTVDVYRVYNDPSTQVQFLWENSPYDLSSCCGSCVACQLGTQMGCLHLRDPRMGFLVPVPAAWNADTQQFVFNEFSTCREPDQIRLWYYSGFRDTHLARSYVDMAPYWETAVAYFAASKLDRAVCGCSNVSSFIEKWRGDMMFASMEKGGFTVTPEFAGNRLGTSVGAFEAFRRIHQNGMRVNK